jgi:hypothetical protein
MMAEWPIRRPIATWEGAVAVDLADPDPDPTKKNKKKIKTGNTQSR